MTPQAAALQPFGTSPALGASVLGPRAVFSGGRASSRAANPSLPFVIRPGSLALPGRISRMRSKLLLSQFISFSHPACLPFPPFSYNIGCRLALVRGAHASGVWFAASRRKPHLTVLLDRSMYSDSDYKVGGGMPSTARGTLRYALWIVPDDLKPARHFQRLFQPLQVFATRNSNAPHLFRNRRQHLDIEQRKAALAQMFHQVPQRDF
jgi:hypothetical protein